MIIEIPTQSPEKNDDELNLLVGDLSKLDELKEDADPELLANKITEVVSKFLDKNTQNSSQEAA
jgi:hypothetical protein